ncbi:MAG: hypothetical protein JXO72_12350 [Vicinamibacteria bacterium]|nr:hypothetical protein [Vicinamibacteria bacterium]
MSSLIVLLAFDLWIVIVTGSGSALHIGGRPVGPWSFAIRSLALGVLLILRFRAWAGTESRLTWGRLALCLFLLPALMQFQYAGGRINGDGMMYYVYVRSIWKDLDLDLTNEYAHYDLLKRGDLSVPTSTGLRRSIFSIGPAVVWTPFFFSGELVARAQAWLGGDADLTGYGPAHRNAVALGSLLYGFGAVWLVHALLARYFSATAAFLSAWLLWGATFLHWYMVQQPTYAHAPSVFLIALALTLWERDRTSREPWRHFVWGLVLGLAMCVRWQNGVFLLLPAFESAWRLWRRENVFRVFICVLCLSCGVVIGVFPQLAAWKALYDEWLLRYPPHSATFIRLDHPFLLNTLFSSRHGLLSWTPALWLGYLGFIPLIRRERRLALALLPPLLAMTYVNACAGDWWCGGSFSNRRFESLLPLFAFGMAAAIDTLIRIPKRWPLATLTALALPGAIWSLGLAHLTRHGMLPSRETFSCDQAVGEGFRRVARKVGSPPTWPASWFFSRSHRLPPDQYDRLVGRYLFYLQNNMGGHIELGVAGDDAMLGEGWSSIETKDGVAFRRTSGRARLFAPLDTAEPLEILFHAAACAPSGVVNVLVNGRRSGMLQPGAKWQAHAVNVPADFWRREVNEIVLQGGCVAMDAVDFVRISERRP